MPAAFRPLARLLPALLMLPALASAADLTPKFRAGDESRYSFISESRQKSAHVGVREVSATTSMNARLRVKVLSADAPKENADAAAAAGGATVELVYERIVINAEAPMGRLDIDTDAIAESAKDTSPARALRAIIGKPVICAVSPTGELTTIDISAVTMPEGDAATMVQQTLSKEATADIIASIFMFRPTPGDSKVGDTWTRERAMQMHTGGGLQMNQVYTIDELSTETARATLSGDITMKGGNPEIMAFMKLKRGAVSGFTLWDVAAGRASSVEFGSELDAEDTNPAMNGAVITTSVKTRQRLDRITAAAGGATP